MQLLLLLFEVGEPSEEVKSRSLEILLERKSRKRERERERKREREREKQPKAY